MYSFLFFTSVAFGADEITVVPGPFSPNQLYINNILLNHELEGDKDTLYGYELLELNKFGVALQGIDNDQSYVIPYMPFAGWVNSTEEVIEKLKMIMGVLELPNFKSFQLAYYFPCLWKGVATQPVVLLILNHEAGLEDWTDHDSELQETNTFLASYNTSHADQTFNVVNEKNKIERFAGFRLTWALAK
jgi:hypothetical protein